MKNKFLKLMSIALATSMLFSACGSTDTDSSSANADASEKTDAADTDAEDTGILTPTGTYPIVKEGEELTITVAAPLRTGISTYARESNSLTRYFEEYTGLTIEWLEVPNADRVTKYNAMMASGDYPDMILDHWWSKDAQLLYAEQGILVPITDLIAEHAPTLTALFEEYPMVLDNLTCADGEIYSMPAIDASVQTAGNWKMYMNKNWMDNLGLEVPTTTDELYTVLKAFKEQDANGNGDPNDEIPLSGSFKAWNANTIDFIMNSFTYYTRINLYMYADEAGQMVYTRVTDEMKEALKYLNKLSTEGLLDSQIFTLDTAGIKQIADNPEVSILGGSAGGYLGSFMTIGGSDRWSEYTAVAPFKGPEGVQYAVLNPIDGDPVLSITDKCEYPEAIVRAWDLFYVDAIDSFTIYNNNGEEGVDYVLAEEGDINAIGEPATYTRITANADRDGRYWSQLGPAYKAPDYLIRYTVDVDENGEVILDAETGLHQETLDCSYPYFPDESMLLPAFSMGADDGRVFLDIQTNLDTVWTEYYARFITGEYDIDAQWDEYVSEMEACDLATYLELAQAAFDAQK